MNVSDVCTLPASAATVNLLKPRDYVIVIIIIIIIIIIINCNWVVTWWQQSLH